MASAPPPDQELERIKSAIISAREKLAREANFDVGHLEGALERVCEQIAAMPMEAARGYAAGLQQTMQLLQALEEDIRQAHDQLEQRLGNLGATDLVGDEGGD